MKLRAVSNLKELFRPRETLCTSTTRDASDDHRLQTPFTRSERERVAFSWWGCLLWHRIPINIRNASNQSEFRRLYTQYLKRQLNAEPNVSRKFYDFVFL